MKISRVFSLLYLCSLTLLNAPAQADVISLAYEKYRLDNGLEVILQPDMKCSNVAISVWYHVGAEQEKTNKTGFAHLFEHLMFEGSKYAGKKNHFKYLESAGKSFLNGWTTFDHTVYAEVVPSAQLPLALWLESDRMGFLLESMTQEMLDAQRSVVKNERRQGYENAPYAMAMEKAWQLLFPSLHPYHGQVIGSMTDFNNASLTDVKNFFLSYYTPANATLAIVGKFDVAATKKMVEDYFASLSGQSKAAAVQLPTLELKENITIREKEKFGKLALIQMQYLTPAYLSDADADFSILSSLLTGDKSSILSKKLMHDNSLVQEVSAQQRSLNGQSVFSISALVNPKISPNLVIAKIDAEIERIKKHALQPTALRKAKNAQKLQALLSLENIGGMNGRIEVLQHYNHYTNDPNYLSKDLERLSKVSPKSIQLSAQKYLNKRVLLIAEP